MPNLVRVAACLAAALVFAACAGGSAAAPPASLSVPASLEPTPAPVASAVETATPAPATPDPTAPSSSPASPTEFTSTIYGYSLTVPAGWKAIRATAAWDGKGAPFHDVPEADQFVSPATASAWFFGAPTTKDLAARAKESIAANAKDHGAQCPAVPDFNEPIEIGGEPGVLMGYDCGILINNAITVHEGTAYLFGFRDPAIHAASYPGDRAIFMELLQSVRFPD